MPKTEEQNKKIIDARREEILEAALEEFSRQGYSGTKISDIVKRAGISQGLIYHYYKSKDELYLAVIEKSQETAKSLEDIYHHYNLRGWDGLITLTESVLTWLRNGGEGKLRFFFMQQAALLKPMPEGVKESLAKSFELNGFLVTLISQAQKDGKAVVGDPKKLSELYWILVQGIIMNSVIMENMELEYKSILPSSESILRVIKK